MGSQLPLMLFHTGTGTDLSANLPLKLPKEQKNTLSFLTQCYMTAKEWDHQWSCRGGAPPRPLQSRY